MNGLTAGFSHWRPRSWRHVGGEIREAPERDHALFGCHEPLPGGATLFLAPSWHLCKR
jgi:hypothetical protein